MALLFYRNNLEVKFYRNNLENKLKIKVANELPDVCDGQYSPANFAPIFSSKFWSTQEDTSSHENSFMQHELSSGDLEESIFRQFLFATTKYKLEVTFPPSPRYQEACPMHYATAVTLHDTWSTTPIYSTLSSTLTKKRTKLKSGSSVHLLPLIGLNGREEENLGT